MVVNAARAEGACSAAYVQPAREKLSAFHISHGRACPAHPRLYHFSDEGGWVYILTNRRNGTLYTGVTADLSRCVWEHREGLYEGFTRQYSLKRLVYCERFEDIRDAIQCQRNMKHWARAWKVRLIHGLNPEWDDLYETLNR